MILRKLRIRRPRGRGICSRYRQVRDMESQLYKHEIARYILTKLRITLLLIIFSEYIRNHTYTLKTVKLEVEPSRGRDAPFIQVHASQVSEILELLHGQDIKFQILSSRCDHHLIKTSLHSIN